jgi:tetratricopeptide (TPR) repeat protein
MHNMLRRCCKPAIFVGLLFACATAHALADSAADCQQDKDAKLRVQGCTDYLSASPSPTDRAQALVYRAEAYEGLEQYNGAIADLNESIKINPTALAYYLRGGAYQNNKDYDDAIDDYSAVLRLKPDAVEVYLARASCRLASGDAAGGITDVNLFIQAKPGVPDGYLIRARAEELQNDNDAAIADLNHVVDDPRAKPSGLFFRALANESKGRADLADADFKEAIALAPTLAIQRQWVEYLRSIQADDDYPNWYEKPYDLFLKTGTLYVKLAAPTT